MTSPQINGDPPAEDSTEEQLLTDAAAQDLAEDVARAASFAEADAASANEETSGPPPADLTAAAFFDVDNTLVHGSSLVHFGRGLAERDYFKYSDMLQFVWAQAKFRLTGRENSDDVAAGRQKALSFIEGRSVDELVTLSEDIYDETIAEKIWPGTRA